MKIHAMSQDRGGCHFYRLRTPLLELRKHGHETSWGVQVTGEQLNELDVLVFQFLNGEQDLDFLRFVAGLPRRPKLVYEVDDDLFTIHEVVTTEVSKKPVLWGSKDVQERVKEALGLVDLVTVTTPYLAEMYRPYAKRVAVLPNSVPDWLLDTPTITPERFTLGWPCSHSHLLDAREHYPSLQKFMHTHPEARFHWVGPPSVVAFAPWQQKTTKWVASPTEYLMSLGSYGFSVGIAPLGDFVFNKGKSGIKADEYSAIGIPSVVSDFPQYRDVVTHGETGFLLKKPSQWNMQLSWLYDNPDEIVRMGKAAKESVSSRTISKTAHLWAEAYEEALDD